MYSLFTYNLIIVFKIHLFFYIFSNHFLCSAFFFPSFLPLLVLIEHVYFQLCCFIWFDFLFVCYTFIYFCSRKNGEFSFRNRSTKQYGIISVKLMYCNEQWPPKISRSKSLESMSATLYGKIDFVFFGGEGDMNSLY